MVIESGWFLLGPSCMCAWNGRSVARSVPHRRLVTFYRALHTAKAPVGLPWKNRQPKKDSDKLQTLMLIHGKLRDPSILRTFLSFGAKIRLWCGDTTEARDNRHNDELDADSERISLIIIWNWRNCVVIFQILHSFHIVIQNRPLRCLSVSFKY